MLHFYAMERMGRCFGNLARRFHGEREVTTWPADREGQRHTKPHSASSVCQNCGWVEVDLALSILIPDTRWSETEKAKVSKPIGKELSFFPSSSHLCGFPSHVPLHSHTAFSRESTLQVESPRPCCCGQRHHMSGRALRHFLGPLVTWEPVFF